MVIKIIQPFPLAVQFLETECGRGYSFKFIQNYFSPQKVIVVDLDEKALKKLRK